MTTDVSPATLSAFDTLERVIVEIVAPAAAEIDQTGAFPRAAIDALGAAGLLGLISTPEVGGQGQAHRAATLVVERLARECASTAMVMCMHYAGTAVIEAHGSREVREAIAAGRHLTTLAFSETGSRSHFWAPISTAAAANGHVQLDAHKSWATAAGQADSYVWSSRPLAAEGASTIWKGFKEYFTCHDLPFDYILYSNYETQVEALLAGQIDVAWNSPLAWVRADRLARAQGAQVRAIAMRDTDCDLTSVIIVRSDSPIATVADLKGRVVAVGAIDSPQAYLLPLAHLRAQGLTPGVDFNVQRHDLLGGKHGDHIGGAIYAARALVAGEADAACMIKGNYDLFVAEGSIPGGATRVLAETAPYDHCNFTVGPAAPQALIDRFGALLLSMSYDDPEVRPLMDLEGLTAWRDGRLEGYRALERAVDLAGFYDQRGTIAADDYSY